MKLTAELLRKIIVEELSRFRDGKKTLTESPIQPHRGAVSMLLDQIADSWHEMYDPGDPSQEPLGQEAWEAQVTSALHALEGEVLNAIQEVEDRLIGGEFYDGPTDDFGNPRGPKGSV